MNSERVFRLMVLFAKIYAKLEESVPKQPELKDAENADSDVPSQPGVETGKKFDPEELLRSADVKKYKRAFVQVVKYVLIWYFFLSCMLNAGEEIPEILFGISILLVIVKYGI